jgi:hypothetical protein
VPERFQLHGNGLVKSEKTEILLDNAQRFAQPVEVGVYNPENGLRRVV